MQTYWVIDSLTDEQQQKCEQLARDLNISPAAASLLIHRNVYTREEYEKFVSPRLEDLHDPYLMADMGTAVERIRLALTQNENILVYGDYDVDGITSVALVYRFLSFLHERRKLYFYIPDRHKEGYGVSLQGIDYAFDHHCSLIISLDCGIKANEAIDYARNRNIDFIVCDHHMPDRELPHATAILDPKREDCQYPYKELSGCGVGFKLMQAYTMRYGGERERRHLFSLLELLAMSIASDIVPLTGENRILAFHGLKQINTNPSAGMQAIMEVASLQNTRVTLSDLVYKIGPRINASGRISSGETAVELLIAEDLSTAKHHSESINKYNEQRKEFDYQTTTEALQLLKNDPVNAGKKTTVVYGSQWPRGVVGIVASRLTETFYRPTIVLADGEDSDTITGSARSVGGFDIYSAIDSCRDLLTNFGGHVFAAGLSMKKENLGQFMQRFEQYVAEHITEEQTVNTIHIENRLKLSDIDKDFFRILTSLEPFGPDNPNPLFATFGVHNHRYSRSVGKDNKHMKLDVTDDGTTHCDGIAFGKGEFASKILAGEKFDICYHIDKNTFRGKETLQLMVEDIKIEN